MSRFFLFVSFFVSSLVLADAAVSQDRGALETRVAQAPDDVQARRALSDFLTAQGEPAAAVPHLVWLADHAPTDAGVHRQLAQTLLWSDRPADAAQALAQVVALDPSDIEARVQLAEIITWDGGADRAVEILMPIAEAHPDDARLHRILAFALLASGDDRARGQMSRALDMQPDDPDLLIESAGLERWQGDWSVAQIRLRSALALDLTTEQKGRVGALLTGIRSLSAATVSLGGTRVEDSNRVLRLDAPGRLDIPLSGRWSVGAELTRGQIQGLGDRSATGTSYLQSVTYRPSRRTQVQAGLGLESTPGARLAATARGSLQQIWTASGFALARLTAQTATATDAVDALEQGLRRSSVVAEGYAEPSSGLSLTATAAGMVYSDDNRRVQLAAATRWLPLSVGAREEGLPLASLGITAGGSYEDSQTVYADASPYYTPDDLWTASAGLAARLVAGGVRLDGTLGGARQSGGATSLEYGAALEYDRGVRAVRVEARRTGSSAYSAAVVGLSVRFRLP